MIDDFPVPSSIVGFLIWRIKMLWVGWPDSLWFQIVQWSQHNSRIHQDKDQIDKLVLGKIWNILLWWIEYIMYISLCRVSMMVKWANDGLLQTYDGKMLVNDADMPVNDGEINAWSCPHFTIINKYFTIINEHFTIISLK